MKKIEKAGRGLLLVAVALLLTMTRLPAPPKAPRQADAAPVQTGAHGEAGHAAQDPTANGWPPELRGLSPESLATYGRQAMIALAAETAGKPPAAEKAAETKSAEAGITKRKYYDVPLGDEVQDKIIDLCAEIGLDPRLVFAIIHHESRFTADAISKTGDYGLMQVNRTNFAWLKRELGINDFLDPLQNVEAGIHILSLLAPKYDTLHKVLMCYAAGENGAKKKWFSRGIYSTTFSRAIIADMENYVLR
jgi:soluble lytic murein transglycosylase-like protein